MQEALAGEMTILHSTPEYYFARINPELIHKGALRISMPGCYTSMVRIKQKHAELENAIFMTEKICSMAALQGLIEYPEADLDAAVEDLLNAQFHDVLPGSSIRAGEENGLQLLDHGLLLCNRLRARAYFALSKAQSRAKEGEFPILVFNPQPYVWETDIVCEMMLADQNWSAEQTSNLHIFDEAGNELPLQIVKEESNLNLDWRKRFVFRAPLAPMSVTRFSVYVDFKPTEAKTPLPKGSDVVFDMDIPAEGKTVRKHIEIDGRTGLLRSFCLDGKEYISGCGYLGRKGAFLPVFYDDNPDPWAMGDFQLKGMGENPRAFALMENPDGPFKGMSPIQVTEDGPICTTVECFLMLDNTRVRLEYTISKSSTAVDVRVDTFMMDADRMLKLAVPAAISGDVIGQTAFGTESLYRNGRENVAQRFVAVRDGNECLALFNKGTYGSSYQDGVLSMSLIRGVTYCAHPIQNRPIIPDDRFTKKMDMGERNFFFRLDAAAPGSLERLAQEFNMPPYACNVFPAEAGLTDTEARPAVIPALSDQEIVLITMKKQTGEDAYLLRLLNNSESARDCTLTMAGKTLELQFGKYQVKTVRFADGKLTDEDMLMI